MTNNQPECMPERASVAAGATGATDDALGCVSVGTRFGLSAEEGALVAAMGKAYTTRLRPSADRKRARLAASLAALTAIALLTLWPGRGETPRGFSWCVACGELGSVDVFLNVALFIPFGAALAWGLPFSLRRVAQALVASLVVSTIIELLQLSVIQGRDSSLSDVVANTLGGALGACVDHEGEWSAAMWRRLSWIAALVVSAVLALGQWAVQPSVTRGPYYVQWLPQRAAYVPFNGTLQAFALDSIQLPPGAVIGARALPDELFDGRLNLRARVIPGSAPHGMALIARLALASGELAMLGRAEDALVFRYRANGTRAGLRSPIFALPGAFSTNGDRALQLEAALAPGRVTLSATANHDFQVARSYVITTARAWALLLPWNVAVAGGGALFDAVWLALLFGIVAYAAAKSRVRLYAAWPVALVALVFICLTSIAPVAAARTVWIGVIAGAALGFWLGARRSAAMSDVA
ncbi:MAG TPA: VanZ family protein [Gemmatimonadaceae bacterium]|nr:VanZ family protein [Gemmatimonadaceae bacterium]